MKIPSHILSIIVAALVGCVDGTASFDMIDTLPVYRGAYDVDRRALGSDSNQQLSYKVNKPYPFAEVLAFYGDYFIEHGWRRCKGGMESWQSFVDSGSGPDELVYQIAHYFTKDDEGKLSTVFIQYRLDLSKGKAGVGGDMQNVFILMQKNIVLQDELRSSSILC